MSLWNRLFKLSREHHSSGSGPFNTTKDQHEESKRVLQAFVAANNSQDHGAMQRVKALTIWCAKCEHGFIFGNAKLRKTEGTFNVLCPRCSAIIITVRTKNIYALRFLALEFPQGEGITHDFPGHEPEMYECAVAFQRHDFRKCIDFAIPLVEISAHPYVVQMLVISALRLGNHDIAAQAGGGALPILANEYPWEATLLKVTLGRIDRDEAMRVAKTDLDRCRVHFYTAARLITNSDKSRARDELQACLAMNIPCFETCAAQSELELT